MSERVAYATFNMGQGFAVYCEAGSGQQVVALAASKGLHAEVAGVVEEGPRRVVVEPLALEYASEELRLGPDS
jgi:phosphoribosylformylglycinamidine cyclo-ligase